MVGERQPQNNGEYLAQSPQQFKQEIVNAIKQFCPGTRFHHGGVLGLNVNEGTQKYNPDKHTATVHVHGEIPRSGTVYQFEYVSGDRYHLDGVVKEIKYLGIEDNQPGHLIQLESVRQSLPQREEQQKA